MDLIYGVRSNANNKPSSLTGGGSNSGPIKATSRKGPSVLTLPASGDEIVEHSYPTVDAQNLAPVGRWVIWVLSVLKLPMHFLRHGPRPARGRHSGKCADRPVENIVFDEEPLAGRYKILGDMVKRGGGCVFTGKGQGKANAQSYVYTGIDMSYRCTLNPNDKVGHFQNNIPKTASSRPNGAIRGSFFFLRCLEPLAMGTHFGHLVF